MNFEEDERAQSVLVGAILLFAILIVAFSSYQAFVVPNQNAEVEFTHNQQVQDDMQDMRSAILRTGGFGNVQSAGIQLGTTYPPRLIALNPPTSSGTLETNADDELEVEILSGTPENEQLEAYWDAAGGDPTTFTTQPIEYQPSYTEYQNPPNTVLEHSILYNRFDTEATLPQNQQAILSGKSLSFVFIDGEYRRSQSGKVELDAKPISAPSNRVAIDGPVDIRLETELSEERWEDLFEDEIEDNEVEIVNFDDGDPNEVILRFDDDYTLRLAKVGAGAQLESPDSAYIIRVGGETARVEESFAFEVRDRYNNPISGVEVDLDGVAGPKKTDSDGRVVVSRDSPGEVTASVGGEDWEEATVNVVEAGEGDSTNGPATVVDEPENDITVTEGDEFRLNATANSVGTTATFRSGTPIQSFIWESSGPNGEERSDEFDDLDPDETNRVVSRVMEIGTDRWEIGDHEISVIAQDATGRETSIEDRGTVTVTVEDDESDPAESALSNLDIAGQGEDATVSEGDAGDVTVDVENVGEESEEFIIELEIANGQTVTDSVTTGELDPGDTEAVTFTDPISGLSADEYTVNVADSDGIGFVSGTLTIDEESGVAESVQLTGAETSGGGDSEVSFTLENNGGSSATIQQLSVESVSNTAERIVAPGQNAEFTQDGQDRLNTEIQIGGTRYTLDTQAEVPATETSTFEFNRFRDADGSQVSMTGSTIEITLVFTDGSEGTYVLEP